MRVLALLLAAAWSVVAGAPSATSAEPSCVQVTWQAVASDCAWSYADYTQTSGSGDGHTWVVSIQCDNGGICTEHVECVEGGQEGYVHDVYMDGTDVGDVCVPDSAVQQVDIAKLVIRQFKRIAWPSSKLVVQPRGGRTLVNFETNFYAEPEAFERQLTLLGQGVEVRAEPVEFAWTFGDGATDATDSPGAPYPDLQITHTYSDA